MTWLSRFGHWIDPTNVHGGVRGALRAVDPTNKNSLVGRVAPYAVGAIPGIGLPLAAGLGAGIRASQAIGRGEDLGGIAGSALQGAGQAGLVRTAVQGLMPGTFAAKAPLQGIGNVAGGSQEGLGSITRGLPSEGVRNLPSWSPTEAANIGNNYAAGIAPAGSVAGAAPSAPGLSFSGLTGTVGQTAPLSQALNTGVNVASKPGGLGHALSGIGSYLVKQPTTIPALLQTGMGMYGASQVGAAEDRRLAMEEDLFNREKARQGNRIGFDEWRARRSSTV